MKVGDKVRILASPYSGIRPGAEGVIVAMKDGGLVRVQCDKPGKAFWFKVEVELVE